MTDTPPTPLPYADVMTPAGATSVTVAQVRADCRRVVVPPVERVIDAGRGLVWAAVALSASVVLCAALAMTQAAAPADRLQAFGPTVELAIVAGIIGYVIYNRRHRRLAYEVTPEALRQTIAGPFGINRAAWPRPAVREVHLNPFNKRLVLRLAGQDPLEVFLGPDRAVNQRVADALAAALSEIPPAPAGSQVAAPDALNGLPVSRLRSVLLLLAGVIAVAGFACLLILPPLSCYIFMLAAAPAGLALGTQRKEFFT